MILNQYNNYIISIKDLILPLISNNNATLFYESIITLYSFNILQCDNMRAFIRIMTGLTLKEAYYLIEEIIRRFNLVNENTLIFVNNNKNNNNSRSSNSINSSSNSGIDFRCSNSNRNSNSNSNNKSNSDRVINLNSNNNNNKNQNKNKKNNDNSNSSNNYSNNNNQPRLIDEIKDAIIKHNISISSTNNSNNNSSSSSSSTSSICPSFTIMAI